MMQELDIRKAELRDIEEIFELMQSLQAVVSFESTITKKRLTEHFKEMQDHQEFYYNLVAIKDKKVVGFVSAVFYQTFFQKNGNGLINELIVHQDHRHQGIGKTLVQVIDEEAQNRQIDGLDVGTEIFNIKAQSFYKKNGFDHQYVLLGKVYQYD